MAKNFKGDTFVWAMQSFEWGVYELLNNLYNWSVHEGLIKYLRTLKFFMFRLWRSKVEIPLHTDLRNHHRDAGEGAVRVL